MAKLIVDGLKGCLFQDDSQICHLQVIKYFSFRCEEHVKIGIAVSKVNDRSNILFEANNTVWDDSYRIDLLDLPKKMT
jgi:hypothetical protein